jgi:hypothetical protein
MVKHYYRLSPVLWDGIPGNGTATVYGIDRMPEGPLAASVKCTPRCQLDPAYYWAGSTFWRLSNPKELVSCCSGPENVWDAIVWQKLPAWLSYVQGLGYTVSDNCKMDPYTDITLIYEC